MKKVLLTIATVVAALTFTACSENGVTDDSKSDNSVFDKEGDAWVKIGISLPGTSSTRGIDDYGIDDPATPGHPGNYGEFNDGDKYEHAVENAILVLFNGTGSDEKTYTIASAYQLSNGGSWNTDPAVQITKNKEFIQQINSAGVTGNLYAYVILNKHSFFEVNNNRLEFNNGKGGGLVDITGYTLAQFMALDIKESGRRYDANSFLMTNMPYASLPGGTTDPSAAVIKTLYPINVAAIYPSFDAAQAGSELTTVNVERVLAKVDASWKYPVSETALPSGATADGNHFYTTDGEHPVEIIGWFIDNTNPNSFVARNYEEPTTAQAPTPLGYLAYKNTAASPSRYRFVSSQPVTTGAYRTFWAIDPNYEKKVGSGCDALINEGGQFVKNELMNFDANGVNQGGRLRANGAHYYCTENTFDVAHQSEFNTTRIVVAADFGDPFYTIEQEAGEKYTMAGIEAYIQGQIAERVSFMTWVSDYCTGSIPATILAVTVTGTDPGLVTVTIADAPSSAFDASTMLRSDVSLTDALAAYKRMVDGDTGLTGHNTYIADNFKVNLYKDGVAYYTALIKHFGDDETPWSLASHAGVANDVNGVYDDLDPKMYLGRYGVVRNNWYNIQIDGIRRIGTPVVPSLPGTEPDTPDDQVENYLKVKINITPWVLRKQNVTL